MTLDVVINAIAKEMNCSTEGINADTPLEELGVDSLKAITILYDLEEQFSIEIPNEYLEEITTVGDIVVKVDDLRAKQAK